MSDDIIHFEISPDLGSLGPALTLALNAALTDAVLVLDIHAMERGRPGLISRELPAMLTRGLVEAAKAPDREGFIASLGDYVVLAQDHEGDDKMAMLISLGFGDAAFLANIVYRDPNAEDSWA